MDINFERILDEENLNLAMDNLLSKRNSCGADGIYVNEFGEYWRLNGENILESIRQESYRPAVVQEREIIIRNGKHRRISIYTCTDRFILRAISQVLQETLNDSFSPRSYGYRKNIGVMEAVEQAAKYIQDGEVWVAEIDLADFFDHLDLQRMKNLIKKVVEDKRLLHLIEKYLYCTIERDGEFISKEKGLVQGSSLSPILSNLYMDAVDKKLEELGIDFCRFVDNINLYAKEPDDARKYYQIVKAILEGEFQLQINETKSGVFPAMNRSYLGYLFSKEKKSKRILVKKKSRKKTIYYNTWHPSTIQQMGRDYHIINNGVLTRRDYTLLFENEEGKRYLPIETMGTLNIYSDVIFSSDFFDFANQHNLRITLYNKYGKLVGTFLPKKHSLTANLILKQVSIYNDYSQRMDLAKKIIMAAVHNIRANLRYYEKKGKLYKSDITSVSNFLQEMDSADKIENLMLIEARCRQTYYRCVGKILEGSGFDFSKRTKRPPQDEVNAMISFGNVFLYERIATEITKASLDVRIGLLHATNKRSESLNLDLAEIFKPIIVDRVIFTLIHKKIINREEHFQSFQEKGVYLNEKGKRLFINALQKKLYAKINAEHREMTYDSLIRNEVQKLYRRICRNEKYKPYKYY